MHPRLDPQMRSGVVGAGAQCFRRDFDRVFGRTDRPANGVRRARAVARQDPSARGGEDQRGNHGEGIEKSPENGLSPPASIGQD